MTSGGIGWIVDREILGNLTSSSGNHYHFRTSEGLVLYFPVNCTVVEELGMYDET